MANDQNIKYVHHENAHNLEAPSIIVPILMDVLKPKSVVDVGCGIGTFLSVFGRHGVKDLRGYDGRWVDREKLSQHIDKKFFVPGDLEKEIIPDRRFDLAVCLEVAEHLKEESADILVKNLTSFSDVIVFAAAVPGQMGQNHVNEQWPDYWQRKFSKADYHFHDVFRSIFWNYEQVPRWYKQNMFLVVKKGNEQAAEGFKPFAADGINSYVHPEYFSIRIKEFEQAQRDKEALHRQLSILLQGKDSFKKYLKIFLKVILHRIKLKPQVPKQ